LIILIISSCSNNDKSADAYGNFESDEVVVGAEESGRLLLFTINEGDVVKLGDVAGRIDTTMLVIKRQQLQASLAALDARLNQIAKTAMVQKAQLELLQKEEMRSKELAAENAITVQKLDQIEGETRIAQRQLEQIISQTDQVKAEQKVIDAQMSAVDEQIRRCDIVAPVEGTVLQKYCEQGELVVVGKPLFKLADLRNMYLRAYVSGSQLSDIQIGASVTVKFDNGKNGFYETAGTVAWIASSAEFTPKIIQTKEERVDLVYAIKILVQNNGQIKIGMPGEVVFKPLVND
jgi:HlyD family secretion protein